MQKQSGKPWIIGLPVGLLVVSGVVFYLQYIQKAHSERSEQPVEVSQPHLPIQPISVPPASKFSEKSGNLPKNTPKYTNQAWEW